MNPSAPTRATRAPLSHPGQHWRRMACTSPFLLAGKATGDGRTSCQGASFPSISFIPQRTGPRTSRPSFAFFPGCGAKCAGFNNFKNQHLRTHPGWITVEDAAGHKAIVPLLRPAPPPCTFQPTLMGSTSRQCTKQEIGDPVLFSKLTLEQKNTGWEESMTSTARASL